MLSKLYCMARVRQIHKLQTSTTFKRDIMVLINIFRFREDIWSPGSNFLVHKVSIYCTVYGHGILAFFMNKWICICMPFFAWSFRLTSMRGHTNLLSMSALSSTFSPDCSFIKSARGRKNHRRCPRTVNDSADTVCTKFRCVFKFYFVCFLHNLFLIFKK